MLAEFGHFALILALVTAGVQAIVPLWGAVRRDEALMGVGRAAASLQFALVAAAFGALIALHVTSDFSVVNVVLNSHTDKPLLYKISGAWASHEGSMLLWVLILTLYGAAAAFAGRDVPAVLRARVLAVQGAVGFAFLLFVLFTSNPFLRLDPPPLNGNGLNPLLQDPGLALHPPFLYLGYVGFSLAFSFAVAALIEGRADAAWARWVKPWALLAWSALTLGIGLGAWWSYYTLGWGGYWSWDPVENASLMPWLAGTALTHSLIVTEKRGALKAWTIFLAIVTFALALLGTFLVRSGVLSSIHAFASDPARGVFILVLLAGLTGGALVLFALRAPGLKGGGVFAPVSRESGLLANNVILSAAAGTVLIGTLYPLAADAFHLGKISVGAPYFNTMLAPLGVLLVTAMMVGPRQAWKRDSGKALRTLIWPGAIAAVTLLITLAVTARAGVSIGFALAAGLIVASLQERAACRLPRLGMTLAHVGVALVLTGIVGSAALQRESLQTMRPGETTALAGLDVRFAGLETIAGPNYTAEQARFEVSRHGRLIAELKPERRQYANPPQTLAAVAIQTNFLRDLYAVLGAQDGDGYVVHLFYNPLVPVLFFGVLMMALGGVLALYGRRVVERDTATVTAPGRPKKMLVLPLVLFVGLVGLLVYRLALVEKGQTPDIVPSAMIGKAVPVFRLAALDGGAPVASGDLKGQVTVINFFASWCAPCRDEHAVLKDLPPSVRLIGIAYKDRPEATRGFLQSLGNPYRVVGVDHDGRAGLDFGVYGVPETYVVDKNGVIRFKQTGPLTAAVVKEKLLPLVEALP